MKQQNKNLISDHLNLNALALKLVLMLACGFIFDGKLSVQRFVPNWDIMTTTEQITMNSPLTMNPNSFGDPMTFTLLPTWGQTFPITKYLEISCLDYVSLDVCFSKRFNAADVSDPPNLSIHLQDGVTRHIYQDKHQFHQPILTLSPS